MAALAALLAPEVRSSEACPQHEPVWLPDLCWGSSPTLDQTYKQAFQLLAAGP
ncbi:hypothetical protein V1286_002715 [Bradyrhizobium algeriense]|uniref:Uncharacterized protein n=1 Tax=Bradyrhizobium algeriense TaxID=634784 RepID=A0ABU8BAN6_9BRAD